MRVADKVEAPQLLQDQMALVLKRASRFNWQAQVTYAQREFYILGVVVFTRPVGKDEELVIVRWKYVPSRDHIRFASADRYMRSSPTATKTKLADQRAAMAWMKEHPQPKQQTERTVRSANNNQGDTEEMATATTATKRLRIKKADAADNGASKATKAAPTKATAKAAAPKANTKVTKAEESSSDEEWQKREAALVKQAVALRKKDMSFQEIADEMNITVGKARILIMRFEAGPPQKATPEKVKADREEGAMSWPAIAAKYGLRQVEAVKLYKQAGGRRGSGVVKKAATKAAVPAEAKRAVKVAKKEAAKSEASNAKPLFADDIDKDELIAKIDGKRIVWLTSDKYGGLPTEPTRVKAGSVKFGRQKNGKAVIQFFDETKSRTAEVASIIKVMR